MKPDEDDAESVEQFTMRKTGIESPALTTAVWADLIRFTHRRTSSTADSYTLEFEVTVYNE